MCVSGIRLRRTKWNTYPGAEFTECYDSVLPNGRVLQVAAAHYLGTKFSSAYKIKHQTSSQLELVHQTCHAISTRLLALTLSFHGDKNGLILPAHLAPVQVVFIPIYMKGRDEEEINRTIYELQSRLKKLKIRTAVDISQKRPGDKFYLHELRGVPIRIEVGPKDVQNKSARVVRRDSGQKN